MGKTQQTSKASRRGWSGLIGDLAHEQDLRAFNKGILDLQCKVVAAEYGALWMKVGDELRMVEAWPENIGADAAKLPVWELLKEAAKGGFERQASHVLKVEAEDGDGENPGVGAHVFVTALRVGGQLAAVSTVVADCRDPGVIQSTVPMRELAAGLYELYFARQQSRELEKETSRVRSAVSILAIAQDAAGFKGACLNLVNELARQLKCTRVTLGWVKGRSVQLQAMSDTEDLKRHSEQVALVELAMSECLDQEQPVVYPPPQVEEGKEPDPLLSQAIVHAHRRAVEAANNRHIASVPLRIHDEWVGVLTLERGEEPFDAEMITHLQLVADVIAPQLKDRRESDRWLVGHAWQSVRKTASYLVGAKHVGWKLLAIAVLAVAIAIVFVKIDYKVSAECVLEIDSKRIVSSPLESDLLDLRVVPGEQVVAGQLLAQLNDREMRLELAEAIGTQARAKLEEQQAGAEKKWADMRQARARADQAQARIDLLQYQIERAAITSPIAGMVLSGDWRQKVGGVIPKGEPMFEIAPLDDIIVLLRVSESDVDQLQNYIEEHGTLPQGRFATRSQPDHKFDLTIERIIPLAEPHNNANVFEIHCRMTEHTNWLRPGMEGLAKVNVGPRPIAWILTHRITDMVRLWIWY
jgi:hypothetical protein